MSDYDDLMNIPIDGLQETTTAGEPDEVSLMDTPIDGTFFEMVAVKGGFMSIKLSVWGDEGKYPHFHFYHGVSPNQDIPNKGHGGGCILIKEAKYFIHGSHHDTMNRKEIEGLIKFLKSKHPTYGVTIWEFIIDTWNENSKDQTQVSLDAPIPLYTHNMPSIKED